ncbi:flagellar biosynthesis protein FlhF [Inhella gelatinilytica]|uniref:Flagellar biosynthesis protein FlhF n=1 Tax=Inhella gelatinilytica TaxID=2795030 RepID=A0A931ND68_9BURK|nr:flagellar biosynthesis protein FlhF [Inhella gelatinilytica]MBH9552767.1 flagellar biosynthesis protein FlhF [Inhella gelatinilytica]
MNMKRFTAATTREAMNLVRAAYGDDAIVLATKPCPEGIEVLAMEPEGLAKIQDRAAREQGPGSSVKQDVNTLGMSTLSFQDYVRERMLRRRKAEMQGRPDPEPAPKLQRAPESDVERARRAQAQIQAMRAQRIEPSALGQAAGAAERSPAAAPSSGSPRTATQRWAAAQLRVEPELAPERSAVRAQAAQAAQAAPTRPQAPRRAVPPDAAAAIELTPASAPLRRSPPVLRDEVAAPAQPLQDWGDYGAKASRNERERADVMRELQDMKGLIEQRFGALAFMEKLQRQPVQARLAQHLLQAGFSPALSRKLVEACPNSFVAGADERQWAAAVLARNLQVAPTALEDRQGVFALIGSTGVGKTTSTAKIAATFAARHGASQLGLITLDAYRLGAHEQLRAYGRILGVPVHTAHDRASLDDLLDLLANKKMVLIDTAGMAQHDTRTRELLDMLSHPSIRKLLVVNASAQGETLDDVVGAWQAKTCEGVVLSKVDEAVRLGPALDTLIRHRLVLQAVANGQRVPEDWVRLSADDLLQLAFKPRAASAWSQDTQELQLLFAAH